MNDFNLNATPIIAKIMAKGKLLIIVAVAAFVVSTVVVLLIPNRYEASALLMPQVANQISKEMFTAAKQEGLTVFGEKEESEQLRQIITSRTLKDMVIEQLDLWKLWGIDPNMKHARDKMYNSYNKSVKISSTQFQGVVVAARDQNPELAATIANTIVDLSDTLLRRVKKEIAQKALIAFEKQYNRELEAMVALEDSMRKAMIAGAVSPEMQAKEITRAYSGAITSGNTDNANKLSKLMEPIKQHGSKYIRYNYQLEYAAENIVLLGNHLKVLRVEAQQDIPSQFVIDRATVPDKKIAPKRTILVVLSTLAAVLCEIFVIVAIEFFNTSARKRD